MITINDLNQYCLIEIFSYVEFRDRQRLESVCKRWQEMNRIIWQSIRKLIFIKIDDDEPYSSSRFASGLKVRCSNIEHLGEIMKKMNGNLEKLSITSDTIYIEELDIPDWIFELMMRNEKLNSLEIDVLQKKLYPKLSKSLKTGNLQHLKMYNQLPTPNSIRDVIKTILKNVPQLETLYLINTSISMEKINKITTLKSLTIMANDSSNLTVKKSELINLQSIHLTDCESINDDFIKHLVRNCPQLCNVEIMSGDAISNKGLIPITTLANLRHFSASKMNDEVFDKLSNLETFSCPNLSLDRYMARDKVSKFFQRSPNLKAANVCLNGNFDLFNDYAKTFRINLEPTVEYNSCFCNINWKNQFHKL